MQTLQISQQNNYEQSVLMIYTGGTLGMIYKTQGLVPFDFEQILQKIPELKQFECNLTVISFEPLIDSSNVTTKFWLKLIAVIVENYKKFDAFVILHGTDTMAYSASILSFLIENLKKTIIFTGAQLPIGVIRNDARQNILTAIEIAIAQKKGEPVVPEVSILFNNFLLRGNRARKSQSLYFDAFHSDNYPHLAQIGIDIIYQQEYILSPNWENDTVFHQRLDTDVGIMKIYPGMGPTFVQQILETPHLKAIVMESFGSGNTPTSPWFLEALEYAQNKNILIVNVSQSVGGRVKQGLYETSRHLTELGVLSGADMTTEAALAKLMFLLGQNLPIEQVKEQFYISLRGEI